MSGVMRFRIGIRKRFLKGCPNWDEYVKWIKIMTLEEIRTIDPTLNPPLDGFNDRICGICQSDTIIDAMPSYDEKQFYRMIADVECVNSTFNIKHNIRLMGFDLADDFLTSSILNCGPLETELLNKMRFNTFGLLKLSEAKDLKEELKKIWGAKEPHAETKIWALYEIE